MAANSVQSTTKQGTEIRKCTCEHKYQDRAYGVGNRVFNKSGKTSNQSNCTVCSKRNTSA